MFCDESANPALLWRAVVLRLGRRTIDSEPKSMVQSGLDEALDGGPKNVCHASTMSQAPRNESLASGSVYVVRNTLCYVVKFADLRGDARGGISGSNARKTLAKVNMVK